MKSTGKYFPFPHSADCLPIKTDISFFTISVPFVGAGSASAGVAFDKNKCATTLLKHGHPVLHAQVLLYADFKGLDEAPSSECLLKIRQTVHSWFRQRDLDVAKGVVVVKPTQGGSSLGVVVALGVDDAVGKVTECLREFAGDVLVEQHAGVGGKEFTVVVIETQTGPVALTPTEIEVLGSFGNGDVGPEDEKGKQADPPNRNDFESENRHQDSNDFVFNFRRKYLPTSQVVYHAPARFGTDGLAQVRAEAVRVFRTLGLRDFARLDGFYYGDSLGDDAAAIDWPGDGFERRKTQTQPVFTDVNVVSGMEQTSFLFLQAAQCGVSHALVLGGVLANARARYGIGTVGDGSEEAEVPSEKGKVLSDDTRKVPSKRKKKRKVYVLFGGDSSERQVSLLSGVNVFLKLRGVGEFDVVPVLLAPGYCALDGATDAQGNNAVDKKKNETKAFASLENTPVFRLPYASVLRHTVEEVLRAASSGGGTKELKATQIKIQTELVDGGFFDGGFPATRGTDTRAALLDFFDPVAETLSAFAASVALDDEEDENGRQLSVVFNAVHGGCGEDGSLQAFLQKEGVVFTGSDAHCSRVCMDKMRTGETINCANLPGVGVCLKKKVTAWEMSALVSRANGDDKSLETFWQGLLHSVGADFRVGVCFKPNSDGCSTGVARLRSSKDLLAYAFAVTRGERTLTLENIHDAEQKNSEKRKKIFTKIEMPAPGASFEFLCEPFVVTAAVEVFSDESGNESVRFVVDDRVDSQRRGDGEDQKEPRTRRLVEITVGVFGELGFIKSMEPSLTVLQKNGGVLSLEEKFQGGTGINITPPPKEILSPKIVEVVKDRIARAANVLGIAGFARIDAFVDCETGDVTIIECNTVPGMTPSTVLFHQALAATPSVEPGEFLANQVRLAVRAREEGGRR